MTERQKKGGKKSLKIINFMIVTHKMEFNVSNAVVNWIFYVFLFYSRRLERTPILTITHSFLYRCNASRHGRSLSLVTKTMVTHNTVAPINSKMIDQTNYRVNVIVSMNISMTEKIVFLETKTVALVGIRKKNEKARHCTTHKLEGRLQSVAFFLYIKRISMSRSAYALPDGWWYARGRHYSPSSPMVCSPHRQVQDRSTFIGLCNAMRCAMHDSM